MKILSWNVNGLQARLEAVNRLVTELQPELMCFQKVRKKGAFLTSIDGYFGWLGIMDDGLFGGVSTYIRRGVPFEFEVIFTQYAGDYYQVTPGWTETRTAWWQLLQKVGSGSDIREAVKGFPS